MITTIFTPQWKELWQICNHDRHGKDYKAQADVAHRQAVTELMTLYELKDSVEPHLKWILIPHSIDFNINVPLISEHF